MKGKKLRKNCEKQSIHYVHSATGQRIFVIAETFKFENNPPRDA